MKELSDSVLHYIKYYLSNDDVEGLASDLTLIIMNHCDDEQDVIDDLDDELRELKELDR